MKPVVTRNRLASIGLCAVLALLVASLPAAVLVQAGPTERGAASRVGGTKAGDLSTDSSPPATDRVSVGTGGAEANGASESPAISADGRYVAFDSLATNLVEGDTNAKRDLFVHDRQTGVTKRVSIGVGGAQANGDSSAASISGDGRYVAFQSTATNLVPGDGNGKSDIFLHDWQTGTTVCVSLAWDGGQANGVSRSASVSSDGQWVAFESEATNLVQDDGNGVADVFLYDRVSGQSVLVSVDSAGVQADARSWEPAVSADGRYVAFTSAATNLVDDDSGDWNDVFVHDRITGETARVSVRTGGAQEANDDSGFPSISADGRYVAFATPADNLVYPDDNYGYDVFVHDRFTSVTNRVSVSTGGGEGDGESFASALSADGRYVAFESKSGNLVPGDVRPNSRDIFRHDRWTWRTVCLSVNEEGVPGDGDSYSPALSALGEVTAFHSAAADLVSGDGNGVNDVFVRSLPLPVPVYLPLVVRNG